MVGLVCPDNIVHIKIKGFQFYLGENFEKRRVYVWLAIRLKVLEREIGVVQEIA